MLHFEFNARAYKDSIQHELIPEGQYRAKICSIAQRPMSDGSIILTIEYQVTYNNAHFKDTMFLNPPSHPYFSSSNKRFGDLCVSCKVNPFDVKQDENILIGCVCGIQLSHKKSKDGQAVYNSVKKFLRPDETERLKEFTTSSLSQPSQSSEQAQPRIPEIINTSESTALDLNDADTWFK